MINIVVAEDQSLLRGALSTLLSLEQDIDVVGTARDGEEALAIINEKPVDVLVTDIEMPNMSGIELANTIQKKGLDIRVLIVTTFARPGYLQRAMAAGVRGYILKDAPSDELAEAVRSVAAGKLCVASDLKQAAWHAPNPISAKERQILSLVECGKTNKEIAAEMHLSAGTVRNYLAEAMQKLGVGNRIEAFRVARENGWL